jgi:cell division protease FtsH
METLENTDVVGKITIVSRGQALGYVMPLPQEDRMLRSRAQYEDSIAGLLAGRVAEEIVFHEASTSAADDLERVTKTAKAMVTRYGMSEIIGPLQLSSGEANPFLGMDIGEQRAYSEDIARKIDQEVRRIIETGYARAREILTTRKDRLVEVAEALLQKEVLDRQEFLAIFNGPTADAPAAPVVAMGD